MEFLAKIVDAIWRIVVTFEPNAWNDFFAFNGIVGFIQKLFQK